MVLFLVEFESDFYLAMLLRSSSTPILNSWLPLSKDSSPEPDLIPLPRNRSITHLSPSMLLTASLNSPSSSDESIGISSKRLTRTLSDSNVGDLVRPPTVPKKKPFSQFPNRLPSIAVKEEEGEEERGSDSISFSLLFTSSGLNETVLGAEGCSVLGSKMKDMSSATLFSGDGFGSGGGGGVCGGGRGGGADDEDGESGFSDSNHGNNSTDAHYQKMIEADPGNGLLLSNYARFLKEVRIKISIHMLFIIHWFRLLIFHRKSLILHVIDVWGSSWG